MSFNKSKYPPNWLDITIRQRRMYNNTCQFCLGTHRRKDPLTTHHIDHDTWNNVDDNLRPLHSSCHLLFHSHFDHVRTLRDFIEVRNNYLSQTKFHFMVNFEEGGRAKILKSQVFGSFSSYGSKLRVKPA